MTTPAVLENAKSRPGQFLPYFWTNPPTSQHDPSFVILPMWGHTGLIAPFFRVLIGPRG